MSENIRFKDRIRRNPFLRNFSLLTIGNFGSRFIAMIINIIVARFLEPEKYGMYSLVMTYVSVFYFVASLGLSQLTTRSVSREQDNSGHFFRLSMVLRVFGFVLSVAAFGIYAAFSSESFTTFITFSILGGVLLESMWDCQQSVAFGMQRMEWNTIIGITASLLNLLIYILLPRRLFSVNVVLEVYLGVFALKNIAYYFCLRRSDLLRFRNRPDIIPHEEYISFIKDASPFYLMYLLGIFTGQLPILFLNANSGVEEVAYFNIANKLLLPITLFVNSAMSALFPNQSKLFSEDRQAFSRQACDVLYLVTGASVALGFFASLFKGEIIAILYGKEYLVASNVFAYQCWYTIYYGIFCLNGTTMGAADAQKKLAVCSVLYALISTPILYFMSRNGAEGMSVGYLVAGIVNLSYILPALKQTVGGVFTWSVVFAVFVVLAFCTTSALVLSSLSLLVRVSVAVTFSVGCVFFIKKSRFTRQYWNRIKV